MTANVIAVDTSALIAIVLNESDHPMFLDRLKSARHAAISTVSVIEARMVVYGRLGQRAVVLLDDLLQVRAFEIVSPGVDEMEAAWKAFIAFGKGSGHPAGLNFGDVFSYALAKVRRVPLLFKGNDFSQTDIVSAITMQ
jgi:ribonuclease VapC